MGWAFFNFKNTMITSISPEFHGNAGETYYFSVTGHSGHTTKFQIQDQLGWHDVADTNGDVEHTESHMGVFRMPTTGLFKVDISGGTGDLSVVCNKMKKPK